MINNAVDDRCKNTVTDGAAIQAKGKPMKQTISAFLVTFKNNDFTCPTSPCALKPEINLTW